MGRSLLLPKGNTLSGLEDLFWLLSRPSNKCGFLNKSMTNLAHPSSTGSASKAAKPILPTAAIFFIPPRFDEIFFSSQLPPQQHFPSSDSVLFNNKSFHQNLHFLDILYMHLLFPIFFFAAKFCQKTNPFCPPLIIPKFKMKKTPPIAFLLVCQVNEHKR